MYMSVLIFYKLNLINLRIRNIYYVKLLFKKISKCLDSDNSSVGRARDCRVCGYPSVAGSIPACRSFFL